MEAEKERTRTEAEHSARASEFAIAQRKLQILEKDMPRSIKRGRPYFELKDNLETRLQVGTTTLMHELMNQLQCSCFNHFNFCLQQERQSVEDLQRALTSAKALYRSALANLESISNEIHASRRAAGEHALEEPLPERTPGVGAEADVIDAMEELTINLGS